MWHGETLPSLQVDLLPPNITDRAEVITIVQTVTIVSCILSIVGSLLIIITYIAWTDIRTRARQIVVFLSIADLLSAVGYLYGTARKFNENSWDCVAQSAVTTFANVSSFFWTCSIAVYIYLLIVQQQRQITRSCMISLHVVNWGVPAIIVAAGVLLGGLGWDRSFISVGWCWVNLDNSYFLLWTLLGGKIWEFSAYILLPALYIIVKKHMYTQTHRFSDLTLSDRHALMTRVDLKLTLIPVIFIFLRVWSTVRYVLYLVDSPYKTNVVLMCLHGVGNTLQGAANCILFCFLTRKVRERLCDVCSSKCCQRAAPGYREADMWGEQDIWHERSGLMEASNSQ